MKKILAYDDYNHAIRWGQTIGTVKPSWGQISFRAGWKLIEIYDTENNPDRENMEK